MKKIYIKQTEEVISEYELRQRALNGSLGFTMKITEISNELLNDFGIFVIRVEDKPFYDPYTEYLEEQPVKYYNGEYTIHYIVRELNTDDKITKLNELKETAIKDISIRHSELANTLVCNSSLGISANNRLAKNDLEVLRILIDTQEFPIQFRDVNNNMVSIDKEEALKLYNDMSKQIIDVNRNKWRLQEAVRNATDANTVLSLMEGSLYE